jgi:hypothetical protein
MSVSSPRAPVRALPTTGRGIAANCLLPQHAHGAESYAATTCTESKSGSWQSSSSTRTNTTGLVISGRWLHLRALEICNVPMKTKSNLGVGVNDPAHDDIFELLNIYHTRGTGLFIGHATGGHLVLNSDSHDKYDPTSTQGYDQTADGFGAHYQESRKVTNFRGCRAWWKSDDGWDFISQKYPLFVERSWAYGNGLINSGTADPGLQIWRDERWRGGARGRRWRGGQRECGERWWYQRQCSGLQRDGRCQRGWRRARRRRADFRPSMFSGGSESVAGAGSASLTEDAVPPVGCSCSAVYRAPSPPAFSSLAPTVTLFTLRLRRRHRRVAHSCASG